MSEHASKKKCFVIRWRDYRESSVLLELLTEDSQYVGALLRAARSQNGQTIDLLTQYEFSWRGNTQLFNITHSDCSRVYQIQGKRLYASLYLNELIKRSMRQGEVIEGLFESYTSTLEDFEEGEKLLEESLRRFEKRLLTGLGYELVFHCEADEGKTVEPDRCYRFISGRGFRICDANSDQSYDGESLLAISQDDFREAKTRRAAKLILREAIQFHIGFEPFKSKQLFETVIP